MYVSVHVTCAPLRISSNPMDKGVCNSVHYQYYGQNSNMVSSVTILGYIILLYALRMDCYPLSCVKVALLQYWKIITN